MRYQDLFFCDEARGIIQINDITSKLSVNEDPVANSTAMFTDILPDSPMQGTGVVHFFLWYCSNNKIGYRLCDVL